MDTKHQPATPLPWVFDDARGVIRMETGPHIANLTVRSGDADGPYLAHAANAYPKLVEALRELQATLGADFLDCPLGKARTLLRELGEPS